AAPAEEAFTDAERAERARILAALESNGWRRQDTAHHLGISRKVRWEKMRKLRLGGQQGEVAEGEAEALYREREAALGKARVQQHIITWYSSATFFWGRHASPETSYRGAAGRAGHGNVRSGRLRQRAIRSQPPAGAAGPERCAGRHAGHAACRRSQSQYYGRRAAVADPEPAGI